MLQHTIFATIGIYFGEGGRTDIGWSGPRGCMGLGKVGWVG